MASEQQEELETLMSIYGDKITVITQGKEYIVSWIFEQPTSVEPHFPTGAVGTPSFFGFAVSAQTPNSRRSSATTVGAKVCSDRTPVACIPVRALPSRLSRLTSPGMPHLRALVRSGASHRRVEETKREVHSGECGGVRVDMLHPRGARVGVVQTPEFNSSCI